MSNIDLLRKEILGSGTFCFYPYLELSTNPSGHLKPCCYYDNVLTKDDGRPYSILNKDTFDNTWNSNQMVNLRKELHQGNIPNDCKKCINDGVGSMRHRSIREYSNNYDILNLVKDTIANDYVATHSPKRLELKPSSLCNLKCVMCNSYDSTQVAKELVELSQKFGGIKVYNGRFIEISSTPGITEYNSANVDVVQPEWSDVQEIWDNFERLVPNLEVLSFAGGEPTIMPSVLKALQYCVESGYSKNITVYLSSNFTNLNKKFFELTKHYKKFELISSIDGYNLVNDYCRFPSKWKQISHNYIEAKKYTENKNIKVMTNITVNCLNILNITDLLNWIEERSLEYPYFSEWPYNINVLMHPQNQQISILPDNLKQLAKSRLENYLNSSHILRDRIAGLGLDTKIHMLLTELDKPSNPSLLDNFKKRIHILDEHRGINICDYIPDLSEVFKR